MSETVDLEEPMRPVRWLLWLSESHRRRLVATLVLLSLAAVPVYLNQAGIIPKTGIWATLGLGLLSVLWTEGTCENYGEFAQHMAIAFAPFLFGIVLVGWMAFDSGAAVNTLVESNTTAMAAYSLYTAGVVWLGLQAIMVVGTLLGRALGRLIDTISARFSTPSPERQVMGDDWEGLDNE